MSGQEHFPAIHWEDNRIFDVSGQVWGVYKLPQSSYENRGDSDKLSVNEKLERFFHNYSGSGQLLSFAKQKSLVQLDTQMRSMSDHEFWHDHVDAALDELSWRPSYDRSVFLVLPLKVSAGGVSLEKALSSKEYFKRAAVAILKNGWDAVQDIQDMILRKTVAEIPMELVQNAIAEDRRLLSKLTGSIGNGIKRATPADIEWMHKKQYFRGLTEPPNVLPDKLPVAIAGRVDNVMLRPQRTTMLQIASAHVEEGIFRIQVEHRDKSVSYQSVMALANFTEEIEDLGEEWLYYPLEKLDFPIDVSIHFTVTPGHIARKKVRRKKNAAQDQWQELDKDGDVPLDLEDGLELAPLLEKRLKAGIPLLEFQAFLAIGADTEERLIEQEETLINAYDGYAKPVHPPGDAKRLWQAFFPTMTGGVHTSWQVPCDPRVLACSGVLGTSALGDPIGMLLGHLTGSGRAVLLDPARPMMVLNHTGSMAFVGTMGSGKSAAMKYIADAILALGGTGYVVDPKDDEYFYLYNRWKSESYWIRYGSDSKQTFTPFRLAKSASESRTIAQSWLSILLNISSSREDQYGSIVIDAALHRLYQGNRWDMDTFIKCLREHTRTATVEEEKKAGELFYRVLEQHRLDPVACSIFGSDREDKSIADARLVVQSLAGLEFPGETDADPDKWIPPQRLAVSMLYLATALGWRKLAQAPRHVVKFFLIDEAWLLRAIPAGRALINRITLMGRSMNMILMLGIQNPDVLQPKEENDDLAGNLGWIFMMRIEGTTQVKHAVEILHLPTDDEWQKVFASYEKGLCMARDPLGRVGELQISLLPGELLKIYGTTPGKQKVNLDVPKQPVAAEPIKFA